MSKQIHALTKVLTRMIEMRILILMMKTKNTKADHIQAVAVRMLGIQYLAPQGRDCTDFHELHVTSIAKALEAAYESGVLAGMRAALDAEAK